MGNTHKYVSYKRRIDINIYRRSSDQVIMVPFCLPKSVDDHCTYTDERGLKQFNLRMFMQGSRTKYSKCTFWLSVETKNICASYCIEL